MIYHPRGTELNRGLFEENSLETAKYEDGTYEIHSNSQNETVIVGSVAYTGWKMIGVVPESVQAANYKNFRYYVFATVLVLMVMLLEGNQLVSRKISKPIRELDASVKAHEAGGKPDIYIGGSSEIRHLGHSVQKSYEQIEKLMDEIIRQQNERRKSELDALQSQINPHFLYNTLESINALAKIEGQEKISGAITELAGLLRASLPGAKQEISLRDELQYAGQYLSLQKLIKGDFLEWDITADPDVLECKVPKLILQPLLENAMKHGFAKSLDVAMLVIVAKEQNGKLLLQLCDNGVGMEKEVLRSILEENVQGQDREHIGIQSIQRRIRYLYGAGYGLDVQSTPGEGTVVNLSLPLNGKNQEEINV